MNFFFQVTSNFDSELQSYKIACNVVTFPEGRLGLTLQKPTVAIIWNANFHVICLNIGVGERFDSMTVHVDTFYSPTH